MKKWNNFLDIIHLFLIYSFCISTIKSFGLRNNNDSLLIFFIKEKGGTQDEVISEEDYMKQLMYKEIYSTFDIGAPKQNIKFYYEMNEIESSISQEFYFPKRSTTFKLIDYKKNNLNFSKELFIFDQNKKLDDFIFYLKQKFDSSKRRNYNSLGLGNPKNNSNLSFLSNVNKNGYINKKIFSFLFGEDSFSENRIYDGQILIGSYPHDISPYFNELDLNFISLKGEKWIIEFDTVKYNDEELKDKSVQLDINLNVMIGPEQFRKKLISSLFSDFLEKGNYKENSFISDKDGKEYIFYTFDNNIRFKKIPGLSFFSKALNETFKISFVNLFRKYNGKFYFTIIFSKSPKNIWVLGQQFFNTYKFVFDLDQGKIGYYKTNVKYSGTFITVLCIIISGAIFGFFYLRKYMMIEKERNQIKNKQRYYPVRKEYINEQKEINKKIKDDKNDKPKKE